MVDFHKLTFLLAATEKKESAGQEEILLLRTSLRAANEKIDVLENDSKFNRMIVELKGVREELLDANLDKETYLKEIEVLKAEYITLTDHQGRLKFRAEDLQMNLDKANLKIKESIAEMNVCYSSTMLHDKSLYPILINPLPPSLASLDVSIK